MPHARRVTVPPSECASRSVRSGPSDDSGSREKKRIDELISDEDRTLLRAQGVIVTSNTPAFAIVEYAKGSDVNLIVMGTHGRGGMAHLLLGSVAERGVRIAPCPVLTVRHPERGFVLPGALAAVTKAAR